MSDKNRVLRSKRLRALLWYSAGGKCQRCGCDLPDDFEADHTIPYCVIKRTNFQEMQVLCQKCNREKGTMQLRKHQEEMLQICDQIKAGVSSARTIIASVTPGGGKSLLPVIAATRLIPTIADAICWVAPRQSLQEQAELAFIDAHWRRFLRHNRAIRSSTNEHNPCRGLDGYVTTYQALNADRGTGVNAKEFDTKRYILFLDEVHHVEEGSPTHEALQPLVDRAEVLILGSGTYERGDGKRIAFLPYKQYQGGLTLNLETLKDPNIPVIRYSRRDALVERAIIPLHFQLVDCRAEWIDKQGECRLMDSLAEAGDDTEDGLYTALNTEYAFELLHRCLDSWRTHKSYNQRSKMLVVAANIASAERYLERLRELAVPAAIATSKEKEAKNAIKRFKFDTKDAVDILVTVAMAYEGLDVPAVTHIACLTHIRSTPWIEQMVTRAARVDRGTKALLYEQQFGYIFAPDDQLFQDCIASIKAEQEPFIKEREERLRQESGGSDRVLEPIPVASIIPLTSAATRERASGINGEVLDYEETKKILDVMSAVGLGGSPIQFKMAMEILQSQQTTDETPLEPTNLTPSQLEEKIKTHIEKYNRRYEGQNKLPFKTLNTAIKRHFGKSRDHMTIEELKQVWAWIQATYPIEPSM